jgi:AcrR family transcriptional regulator
MTTREDISTAILTQLDGGFDALTVDALARTLHMSKSTLYKHFESLDGAVYATIESLCTETGAELEEIDTSGSALDTFNNVAQVFGRYADKLPVGLIAQRHKLTTAAKMRLDNTEERLGERMFRAAMGAGASSYVAYGIRSAYEGLIRFLRTVPRGERHSHVAELTAALRKSL